MSNEFKITIYAEPPLQVFKDIIQPPNSGSLYNDGLYLADDSADPLTSTLTSTAALVDLDYETPVITGARTTNESIGVDLGSAKSIAEIKLIDDGTAGVGINWTGTADSAVLYGSTDNATWTLLRSYKPITRSVFSGALYQTSFSLFSGSTHTESYRYFKLYADQTALVSLDGTTLVYTEILTTEIPPAVTISGSLYREYNVKGTPHDSGTYPDTVGVGVAIGGGEDNTLAPGSAS